MADQWWTVGPQPVYDANPGSDDRLIANATGGQVVAVKDGPAYPMRDMNGNIITEVTSNVDGQTSTFQFLAPEGYGLMQFGNLVVTVYGNEVPGLAQNAANAVTSAQAAQVAAEAAALAASQAAAAAAAQASMGSASTVTNVAITTAAFGIVAGRSQVEAAIAATPEGGTVWFPQSDGRYEWAGDIVVTKKINLFGPGKVSGSFMFGDGSVRMELGCRINLNFRRELNKTTYPTKGYADGSYFIAVNRARDIQVIPGASFYGAAWPIFVMPNATAVSHDNSMIRVNGARFDECDWAFYAPFHASSTWQALADSNFTDNMINRSYVGMYYAQGLDGGLITGNTHFMINYGSSSNVRFAEKRQNIRIDYSDQLQVNDNNLFEAGNEAILLDHTRLVKVSGNNIVWPGQRVMSDAIVIKSGSGGGYATGEYSSASVSNNAGMYYSKSLLRAEGDFGGLSLSANNGRYSATSGRYVGTEDLTSVTHYRYDLVGVTGITASQINLPDTALTKTNHADRLPGHLYATSIQAFGQSGVIGGGSRLSGTFTTTTGQSILNLRNAAEGSSSYTGEAALTVRSSSNKESVYKLLVCKTVGGTLSVVVMGSLGYLSGLATDEPSFSWSVSSGNALVATPIGQTAGVFTFSFTFSGNLIVG